MELASVAPTNVVDQIMEQLCLLLHAHRWSLKRAFEYFDADGDGVLSPDEFKTAVNPNPSPNPSPNPNPSPSPIPSPRPRPRPSPSPRPSPNPSPNPNPNLNSNPTPTPTPTPVPKQVDSLSSMEIAPGEKAPFRLSSEQIDRLVASLDRDQNGVIDYDEFIEAIGPRDALER